MIDDELRVILTDNALHCCLIGAAALAVHGLSRYSADIDLLTMDSRVLDPTFWAGHRLPEIRRGDFDDPLAGVIRWPAAIPHDLILGRGYAMRYAVDTAQPHTDVSIPVATALALVLLKLEAGGPQDAYDILGLIRAQRELARAEWLTTIPTHIPRLTTSAQALWSKLQGDLGLSSNSY